MAQRLEGPERLQHEKSRHGARFRQCWARGRWTIMPSSFSLNVT
jgi:hypothetical protein